LDGLWLALPNGLFFNGEGELVSTDFVDLGGVLGGGMGMARSGQPTTDIEPEVNQSPVEESEQQPINAGQEIVPITQDPPGAEPQMNRERGKYRGIDDDVLIAEKQGFADEAVRLRAAARKYAHGDI